MPISPLGGVAGRIRPQIMKPVIDLLFVFHYNYLPISYRLEVIQHFSLAGIPYLGGKYWGFSGPETPKS